MNYKAIAIISPYVFIEDSNKNLLRISIADIDNFKYLRIGNTITRKEDGMFTINGAIVDPDCIGGVCPIK